MSHRFDGTDLPGRGLFEVTIGVGQVIKGTLPIDILGRNMVWIY
jgi:hypothetical protein